MMKLLNVFTGLPGSKSTVYPLAKKKLKTYNSSYCYSSVYQVQTCFNFFEQFGYSKLLNYYIAILNFDNATRLELNSTDTFPDNT
ncbi:hypothetical protein SAMN05660909_04759 [Chitinophaga terrae (ex Kim and Jung 2007)]|uniref:Uncharacterized protein n=1 Tax=Chitinophaga terrae (ex Kim and Jung 2007) TaxID=408074 RepID=A0A1H4FX14_9BACT|nr:hypothetical protein SAMN05660909_04759 [Chitinophaga terrae (ex Kim and Jung 2007)]